MLGLEMLLNNFGVDPQVIQQNVSTAVAHVKSIDERMGRLEAQIKALGDVSTHVYDNEIQTIQKFVLDTYAICLRTEDAINKLRTDSPDNSDGFIEQFMLDNPAAAEQMQVQVETFGNGSAPNGRGNEQPTNTTSN